MAGLRENGYQRSGGFGRPPVVPRPFIRFCLAAPSWQLFLRKNHRNWQKLKQWSPKGGLARSPRSTIFPIQRTKSAADLRPLGQGRGR